MPLRMPTAMLRTAQNGSPGFRQPPQLRPLSASASPSASARPSPPAQPAPIASPLRTGQVLRRPQQPSSTILHTLAHPQPSTSCFRPCRYQSSITRTMSSKPLKVGDTIPSGVFRFIPYTPELASPTVCANPIDLKTDEWKGKKIVLFGVPGAFTKTCSANHLPPYIAKAKEIKSKGVSAIYCIASNDAFVMSGWGRLFGSHEHVEMISDATLQWLEAAGLTIDLSSAGLGKRGTRFALIIDDLKVKYVGIEESPGGVAVSGVDAVLAKL